MFVQLAYGLEVGFSLRVGRAVRGEVEGEAETQVLVGRAQLLHDQTVPEHQMIGRGEALGRVLDAGA